MDRLSKRHARGIEIVLQSPEGDVIKCAIRLQFPMTDNEAEYEIVLMRIDLAKVAEASLVIIHNDSQVFIGHINEEYEAKGEWMKKYLSLVKR